MLVYSSEGVFVLVRSVSHTYVYYPKAERKSLAELFRLEKLAISAYIVFVRHGYLQQGGYRWHGSQSQRYHIYIIPSIVDV